MKRLVVGMACILATGCLFAAEEVNLPEGYRIIESTSPCTMVLTPYTTYPVLLQKYVPVNLFEGKWGSKPGEFGLGCGRFDSLKYPDSLAVDSKDNIYILDKVNNRIQKFDAKGKYQKSIKLIGMDIRKNTSGQPRMNTDDSYYTGVNIEIDSKDGLYYYCYRGDINHAKAELWEFHDDVLLNKWDVPIGGFVISESDDLWVDTYNVRKQLINQYNPDEIILPWLELAFEVDNSTSTASTKLTMKIPHSKDMVSVYRYVSRGSLTDNWIRRAQILHDGFLIYHAKDAYAVFDRFNTVGRLLSIMIAPPELDFPRARYDKTGNIYELVKNEHALIIRKWMLMK